MGRNKETLCKVLDELNQQYPENHTTHTCDITKSSQIDTAINEAIDIHGTPDLIINNAAIIGNPQRLDTLQEEEITNIINTNLT